MRGMSESEFRRRLEKLERALARMRAIERGEARVVRYWREPHVIKRHEVAGHWVTRVLPGPERKRRRRRR